MESYKVVLLGEGCVGKTSIVLRFVEGKFITKHISTLQASFLTKKITFPEGHCVQLNIWDTAGQERFHALGPIYYRGAHGAILVFDVTDKDSFEKVKNWVKELKRMLGSDIKISIAGNKSDLNDKRTVSSEEAFKYSNDVGAIYIETSAKANEGIEELFLQLTNCMIEGQREKMTEKKVVKVPNVRNTNTLLLEDENIVSHSDANFATEIKNSSCCGTA